MGLEIDLRGRSQLADSSRVTFKAPAPELATPAVEGEGGLMIGTIVLAFVRKLWTLWIQLLLLLLLLPLRLLPLRLLLLLLLMRYCYYDY